MNYQNKKIAITGASGFIGSHLAAALDHEGAEIVLLTGDIRDRHTFAELDHTFDYLFHFAAPSSQVLFKRMPGYCMKVTTTGFMNAADAAKRHGIRLVYPSTGLLSSDKLNEYALCKKWCEQYAAGKNMDSIGLRIFATYGPGEDHKRDYASVPFLFARDMVEGKRPVIYGDGTQVRDFIYINDTIQAILHVAEECQDPIMHIGSGASYMFSEVVNLINKVLDDTPIEPKFVGAPDGYVGETAMESDALLKFYTPEISMASGIAAIVSHLQDQLKPRKESR